MYCYPCVSLELHNTLILGFSATSRVLAARQHRDKLYRRGLSFGTPEDWRLFRQARNKVNCLLKSAKSQYLTDLRESSKGSSKQFWSHFRYLSTKGAKSNHNNNTLLQMILTIIFCQCHTTLFSLFH